MNALLGIAASLSWFLSKIRIAFVSVWLIAVLLLGLLLFGIAIDTARALDNPQPTRVTVAELESGETDARWVEVEGYALLPSLTSAERNRGQHVFHYLASPDTDNAVVMVRLEGNASLNTRDLHTVRGMVRPVPDPIEGRLIQMTPPGFTVRTDIAIAKDEEPIPPLYSAIAFGVTLLLIALLLLGHRNQCTHFAGGTLSALRDLPAPPTADQPYTVRVTGRFSLPEGGKGQRISGRMFTGRLVPGEDAHGRPAGHFVLADVRTGSGVHTFEIAIPSGTRARTGWMYDGPTAKPALQFTADGARTTVAFGSPAQALTAAEALAA